MATHESHEQLAVMSSRFDSLKVIVDQQRSDRLLVQLNRPDARNAIDEDMVREFHEVCTWLEQHPRTLIITGCGYTDRKTGKSRRIFASGADISELAARRREDALRGVNSALFSRINRLPMPVIAAIDGYALGGGAELAYAADFRLATPRMKMGQPEVGLGITAGAGGMWRLKELVGEPLALELLITARILDADEAQAVGLVHSVHPEEDLLSEAHRLADVIAEQDPLAVQLTKKVFRAPPSAHPVIDDLAQAIAFESDAKAERMAQFLNRKKEK